MQNTPKDKTSPKLYTVEDLMNVLQVRRETIYRYFQTGKLKSVKLGKRYVTEEALQAFLNSAK